MMIQTRIGFGAIEIGAMTIDCHALPGASASGGNRLLGTRAQNFVNRNQFRQARRRHDVLKHGTIREQRAANTSGGSQKPIHDSAIDCVTSYETRTTPLVRDSRFALSGQ